MDSTEFFTEIDSPVGRLLLGGCPNGLTLLIFQVGKKARPPDPGWRQTEAPFREAIDQLAGYFAGELRSFDLALLPEGTPFQLRVWRALREIPYGETRSYGQLAAAIGQPSACRAVGAANGKNRLPIVIPCHRVIGGDGSLTGFGGGLPAKRHLLALEGAQRPAASGQLALP